MKNFLVLVALSGAAIAATLTSCQTTSESSGANEFAKTDRNRDGKLSRDEASDYLANTMFASRDANEDGNLTWEEWTVPGERQGKARFNAADTNKDGSLSRDEALAYGRNRRVFGENFRSADTNHDGFVTREEVQAYYGSREGPVR
jgi:Ca2+-binding EF-hand superfamily protein